jgi:NAD(P)-dependent dehydrogenase (short-subunit alcohol dehydrogenase family)
MGVRFDLSGRRLLVVGASSGIGREIARQLSAAGAQVAVAARRRDRLDALVADFAGPPGLALACDVRRPDDCKRAVEDAAARFGGLDGFVYATGMSPIAFLDRATPDEWRAVLETNLIGASLVAAAAVPHLRKAQGRAVFLGSSSVRDIYPGLNLYRTSKLALDGLIEGLRSEHRDIDFTRVVVGQTLGTEFGLGWDPGRREEMTAMWMRQGVTAVPTLMAPETVAEAVVSLFALQGYVDDLVVLPRASDPDMLTAVAMIQPG